MKENLKEAIRLILREECGPGHEDDGALHLDPDDPGGTTKYGISQKAFPKQDIAKLTKEDAEEIYEKVYWRACSCDNLTGGIDLITFDCAVNCGSSVARKIGAKAVDVADFIMERRLFYENLVVKRPSLEKFLPGWRKRLDRIGNIAIEWEARNG